MRTPAANCTYGRLSEPSASMNFDRVTGRTMFQADIARKEYANISSAPDISPLRSGRTLPRIRSVSEVVNAPSQSPDAYGRRRERRASHAEEHGRFAPRGYAVLEVLHDDVAPRQDGLDFVLSHHLAHHLRDAFERQSAHALEEGSLAASQLIGLQQFLPQSEGARVVDHPEGPVLGPQHVALVAIAILNQLVEDSHHLNL